MCYEFPKEWRQGARDFHHRRDYSRIGKIVDEVHVSRAGGFTS